MIELKAPKHKHLTDNRLEEQAKEIQRAHMVLGGWMVDGTDCYGSTEEPEELIRLLIRQRNFGVLGKLIEGEMLVDDFDTIQEYSLLENLYSTNQSSIVQTIMLAARARLELVISDGANFEELYCLSKDAFSISGEIELNELSAIADMSLQSVRNQISQGKSGFSPHQKDGKYYVYVDDAKLWLKKRNSYKPTINFDEVRTREHREDVLLVPVAQDGSYLNSDCRMTKGYQVGEKGSEVYYDDFLHARDYLMMMPFAKWRRPNTSGNFGIVSASEWQFIPKEKVLSS